MIFLALLVIGLQASAGDWDHLANASSMRPTHGALWP